MSNEMVIDIREARRRRTAARVGVDYDRLDEPSEQEKVALQVFHAALEGLQEGRSSEDIDRILDRMDMVLEVLGARANT